MSLCTASELPYELTSKIFIHCLPAHRLIRPGRQRAPMKLAQICSQWRAVALTTPELWSSIYLEFGEDDPSDAISMLMGEPATVDYTCDIVELWLTRAAHHPLSITLISHEGNNLPGGLMSTLARYSTHWGRIELKINSFDLANFGTIHGPFPSLRSVAIALADCHWQGGQGGCFPSAVLKSPHLKAFHLSSAGTLSLSRPPPLSELPASVTALETVDIRYCNSPVEDLIQIFQYFPRLRHLRIFSGASHPDDLMTPKITHSLRSLWLVGGPRLLGLIDTSTLEHLTFEFSPFVTGTSLAPFLPRPGSQITHLTLRNLCDLDEVLLAPLSCMTRLTTLELFCVNSTAFTEARYTFLQREALPSLQTLIITDDIEPAPYRPFLAVLFAQRTLRRAELKLRPYFADAGRRMALPQHTLLAQFQALAEHGLSIRITTPFQSWCRPIEDDDATPVSDHLFAGYNREFFPVD